MILFAFFLGTTTNSGTQLLTLDRPIVYYNWDGTDTKVVLTNQNRMDRPTFSKRLTHSERNNANDHANFLWFFFLILFVVM